MLAKTFFVFKDDQVEANNFVRKNRVMFFYYYLLVICIKTFYIFLRIQFFVVYSMYIWLLINVRNDFTN